MRVLAAGLLAAALGAAWLAGAPADPPVPAAEAPVAASAAWPAPAAPALSAAEPPRLQAHAAERLPPALPACPDQALLLRSAEGVERACVGATRVSQSGDLRSLWLEPQGLSRWRLRVDTGEGRVMAAELVAPDGRRYGCEQEACTGWQLAGAGPQGARRLHAQDAELQAPAGAVHLSTTLAWPDDESDPALACGEQGIDAISRDGARRRLCASAGLAVARQPDGSRLYSLRNASGETLVVGIADPGEVRHLAWRDLQCDGAGCSGAALAAGPDGALWLSLSGVTLAAPAASPVRLEGQVALREP